MVVGGVLQTKQASFMPVHNVGRCSKRGSQFNDYRPPRNHPPHTTPVSRRQRKLTRSNTLGFRLEVVAEGLEHLLARSAKVPGRPDEECEETVELLHLDQCRASGRGLAVGKVELVLALEDPARAAEPLK
jgi:hypothetical protein